MAVKAEFFFFKKNQESNHLSPSPSTSEQQPWLWKNQTRATHTPNPANPVEVDEGEDCSDMERGVLADLFVKEDRNNLLEPNPMGEWAHFLHLSPNPRRSSHSIPTTALSGALLLAAGWVLVGLHGWKRR